jgi:uncharacterized protein YjbI with pentapeptide repeats
MQNADLREANCKKTCFRGADLRQAQLQNVNLSDADLHGASLSGARLQGARCSWEQLQKAIFTAADLEGILLHGSIPELSLTPASPPLTVNAAIAEQLTKLSRQ